MRGLAKPDSVGGLILLAFALFYLSQALTYPYSAETGMGEGFTPFWLGVLLALGALLLIVQSVASNKAYEAEETPDRVRALIWLALMVAASLSIDRLGMLFSLFLFTVASAKLLGRGWLGSVVLAVVLTGAVDVLFQWWLKVQLPAGPGEFKGFVDLLLSR